MIIPLTAPIHQLLWNNSVLAGDSSSGFNRGITHFFMATRNTTEGVGEKEQRTMWAWVNSKCKKGGSVTLHSLCIYRLTLACISSEISTKLLGMPTHPDWPSLTAPFCITLRQLLLWVPFSNSSLTGIPLPTSSRVEISSSGLCLDCLQTNELWLI